MRRKFRYAKKLTPKHREFVITYGCNRYNPHGLYKRIYFCEDEDIAIVTMKDPKVHDDEWGCVNMAHQLILPFEFEKIFDFGRFLIARNSDGTFVYNKKGRLLYDIMEVEFTEHKSYIRLIDAYSGGFRLVIRKKAISNSLFQDMHVLDNGLVFLENTNSKVGIILFSKLKLPFEYTAVAIPQNGFTLGIKESQKVGENEILYDCQLLKVKSQIKSEGSIHPTGINLLSGKTWDEIVAYFKDMERFDKECNSIVCYNQNVHFDTSTLEFFPSGFDLPNHHWDQSEEEEEPQDDFNPWNQPKYTYEQAIYDALGGEMSAIWNID